MAKDQKQNTHGEKNDRWQTRERKIGSGGASKPKGRVRETELQCEFEDWRWRLSRQRRFVKWWPWFLEGMSSVKCN